MYSGVGQSPGGERDLARDAIGQRLRKLPSELVPPFDWDELRRRAVGARPGAARHRPIAIAACAAVLILAAVVASRFNFNRSGPEAEHAPSRPDTAQLARPNERVARPREQAVAVTRSDALLAQASTAERWLASEPDAGPIVRVSTRLAVTHLEDSIASMDDLLNLERLQHARASRLRELQLRRAQLVDSLAQVRYAEILSDEVP